MGISREDVVGVIMRAGIKTQLAIEGSRINVIFVCYRTAM